MAGRLESKVALISGTGGGQGRAAALLFAREGARIVGCDVNVDANEETVRRVIAAGGEMVGMAPVDAGDPDQAGAWVEQAAQVYGRIDVLYNNAASARVAEIESLSVEDWRYTMKNVVDIVVFPTRAAWPYLKVRGGVVISTASVSGHLGLVGQLPYSAGKAAVMSMARTFAAEGAPHGIRSFSISPAPILVEALEPYLTDPVVREQWTSSSLFKRAGQPEEVASVALFLASEESSYMTGSDIPVDGGMLVKRPASD